MNDTETVARIRELHAPIDVCSKCGLDGCGHTYAAAAAVGHPLPPRITVCRECHHYEVWLRDSAFESLTGRAAQSWPCATMAIILGAEDIQRRTTEGVDRA